MRTSQRIDQVEQEQRLNDFSGSGWHSDFYHKHFQGYSEYVTIENGKRKIHRIYTGAYYRPEMTKTRRRAYRIIYSCLCLFSIIMFIMGALQKTVANTVKCVAFFQALTVPCLFWLFISVLLNITQTKDMKEANYRRAVQHLRKSSILSTLFLCMMIIATLYVGISQKYFDNQILILLVSGLLSAFSTFSIWKMETKISYQQIDNECPEPYGSTKI